MLLSLFWYMTLASVSFQLTKWKEKQSEKLSTRWKPGESSLFKLSKARKTSFRWLFMSTMELLIFKCYLVVRWHVTIW